MEETEIQNVFGSYSQNLHKGKLMANKGRHIKDLLNNKKRAFKDGDQTEL